MHNLSTARTAGPGNGRAIPAAARLLLWLMAVVSLAHLVRMADDWPGMDFYQFWATGMTLRAVSLDNIYSAAGRTRIEVEAGRRGIQDPHAERHRELVEERSVVTTYSTPFFYTALSVFGLMTYEKAYWSFQLLSLAAMVIAAGVFSRMLRLPTPTVLAVFVFFMAWFEPLQSDVRVANVNRIEAVLLALFCWVEGRGRAWIHDLLGGILLGLAVAFKPNVAFVPLLWTCWLAASRRFDRLYPMVSGCALGVLSAMAVSLLLFDHPRCWMQWLNALNEILERPLPIPWGNFSPTALMLHWTGTDPGWLFTPLFLLPAAIALWRAGRGAAAVGGSAPGGDPSMAVGIVGLGVLVYLLSARLVWLHYHVLALPALLWSLRPAIEGAWISGPSHGLRTGLGVAAMALAGTWTLFIFRDAYLMALSLCLEAALLYGLILWELGRGRRPLRESSL